MPVFDNFGKKLSAFSQDVANQSRTMTDNAKARQAINQEEAKQTELFETLGRQYYARMRTAGTTPEEEAFLFASIDASKERIMEYKQQIAQSQGKTLCPMCGAEHAIGARFCTMCGTKLTEESSTAE